VQQPEIAFQGAGFVTLDKRQGDFAMQCGLRATGWED
jgi:hypothetical protein